MPGRRKLNLKGKASDEPHRKTEARRGSTQDLIKERALERERLIPDIENLLQDWDGGGICIVFNNHDENDKITGHQIAVVGAEHVTGIMKLARAVHNASETIVDDSVNAMKEQGAEGVIELMKAAAALAGEELK